MTKVSALSCRTLAINRPFITGAVFAPESTSSSEEIRTRLLGTYPSSGAESQAQIEEVVDKLMELYPDIPALGSPYNTGNETFGLSSQYKRLGSLCTHAIVILSCLN